MLEDVNTGIAWVLRRIQYYGGDPANVTVVGQSCGAQLASLAITIQVRTASTRADYVFIRICIHAMPLHCTALQHYHAPTTVHFDYYSFALISIFPTRTASQPLFFRLSSYCWASACPEGPPCGTPGPSAPLWASLACTTSTTSPTTCTRGVSTDRCLSASRASTGSRRSRCCHPATSCSTWVLNTAGIVVAAFDAFFPPWVIFPDGSYV